MFRPSRVAAEHTEDADSGSSEGTQVRWDGTGWLLLGEGPLGTDGLRFLRTDEADEGVNTTTGQRRDSDDRSPVRVVGASRVEPHPRPVLGAVRPASSWAGGRS
jgi:hypothetical protein